MGALAYGTDGGEAEGTEHFGGVHPGALVKARMIWMASPLAGVSGPLRAAIFDVSALEALPVRRVVGAEGEPLRALVVIGSGRVRVERSLTGRPPFPVGHRGPGDLVGLSAFTEGVAGSTSRVIDQGEAIFVPMKALRRMANEAPVLRAALLRAGAVALKSAQRRLETSVALSIDAKLSRELLHLASRWGVQRPDGTLISAPFTHADLAALIGTTRETVTLLIGRFRRDGWIDVDHRRVVLRDGDAITRCAAL